MSCFEQKVREGFQNRELRWVVIWGARPLTRATPLPTPRVWADAHVELDGTCQCPMRFALSPGVGTSVCITQGALGQDPTAWRAGEAMTVKDAGLERETSPHCLRTLFNTFVRMTSVWFF